MRLFEILRRVALVITDVSEERIASTISFNQRDANIVSSNQCYSVSSKKTVFLVAFTVKASNLKELQANII
jgi:hypothetical protein